MKKIIIIPVAAVALGATLLLRAQGVSAQELTTNPTDTLVVKLAQKFNLNQSDVQSVFTEHRNEMHTQMLQKYEERLTQDVNNGNITEAQKQLILAKHKEMHDQMQDVFEDMKSLSAEEKKTAMQKRKEELESWAKQNNIDVKYIMPHMGRGKGKMMMKFD